MNVPPNNEQRAQRAATNAGSALSDTVLARRPPRAAAAVPMGGGAATVPVRPVTSIPASILGIWVGFACIVLMIGSAAALRSVFGSKLGAGSQSGPVASASPSASSTSAVPMPSGSPATAGSGAGLSIGGGSDQPSGSFGALAIRDRLSAHVRLRKVGLFVDDLDKLVKIEPTAINRPDVRKMVGDMAVFAMTPTLSGEVTPEATRLFEFITDRAGSAGPDILFDLVTTRGGARAATYADDLLRRDDILAKATPELKIANELRTTKDCKGRARLFDRVKKDGDRRVLQFLFQMARCGKGPESCCLANDPRYKEAVRIINSKK